MHSGVCLCVTYNWLVSHFQTCSSNVRRLLILHSALRQPSALLLIPIHIIYRIIRIFSLVVCLARAQSTTKRTHKSIPDRLSSSQPSGASRYARGSRCPTHSLCRLFLFRARACPAIVVGAPKHVNYIYVFIHVGHLGRAGFCWFVVCQTARRMPHTISLSPFYIIISVQRARSSSRLGMSRCARGVVRPAGHTRPFSSAADICVYMQCGDRPTDRPTIRSPDMSFCANDESTVCEFIKWIARVCLSYVAAAGACRFVAVSTSIDALRCTSGLCNSKAI